MISPELLAELYSLTHWVIKKQTAGLTHEDSLLQPPFRGNCLNWVLGHIVASRNHALSLLDEPPVWSETEAAPYVRGSAPITDGMIAHSLEKILSDLECSQQRLMTGLRRATLADMQAMRGDESVGQQLAGLFFHESYHTGQTEQLRQLTGINDAIV